MTMKSISNQTTKVSNTIGKIGCSAIGLLLVLLMVACEQHPTKQENIVWSYLSLTNNGTTYNDTLGEHTTEGIYLDVAADSQWSSHDASYIGCFLDIRESGSTLNFQYRANSNFPFAIKILGAKGPASGVGTYKIVRNDTAQYASTLSNTHGACAFIARGNDKEYYPVDSAMINITKAADRDVEATFTMWATHNGTIDTFTGKLLWHSSSINMHRSKS